MSLAIKILLNDTIILSPSPSKISAVVQGDMTEAQSGNEYQTLPTLEYRAIADETTFL